MRASSRLCPSATCYLAASTSTPSPPRRRRPRRLVPRMGQSPGAPWVRSRSGNRNRSSSRWPLPALRLDLGFLLGRKPRSGSERLELANWIRCFMSPPLPPPTAEADATAEEEGRIAGSREEEEVGSEEADHLVVMVNGLYGSSADWKFAAEQFVKRLPGKVYVHRSQCNHSKLTYDGVDLMGERLAEEVRQVVHRRRNLRKISFVAHSLGGLVARYAIGKLYEPSISKESCLDMDKQSDEQKIYEDGKIAGLEPMNFIASATPHLGSRWNKQLPYLFGIPLVERIAARTAHFIVGRTGKHLFLTDRDDGKPPLLLRMVENCEDGKFMSALRSFKHRVAYANITYDHIVGWRTSSIRRQHELPKLRLTANDEKYPHVIHVDTGKSEGHQQEDSAEASLADGLEEMMIRGLTQVTWERVDVCFHKSWLRCNAHDNIQVELLEDEAQDYQMKVELVDSENGSAGNEQAPGRTTDSETADGQDGFSHHRPEEEEASHGNPLSHLHAPTDSFHNPPSSTAIQRTDSPSPSHKNCQKTAAIEAQKESNPSTNLENNLRSRNYQTPGGRVGSRPAPHAPSEP